MFRKIAIAVLIVVIFVLMLWFSRINPGMIDIDFAFGAVQATISVALAVTFVFGWVFGLACSAAYIVKLVNERRRLRKSLRIVESEVTGLRKLSVADTD